VDADDDATIAEADSSSAGAQFRRFLNGSDADQVRNEDEDDDDYEEEEGEEEEEQEGEEDTAQETDDASDYYDSSTQPSPASSQPPSLTSSTTDAFLTEPSTARHRATKSTDSLAPPSVTLYFSLHFCRLCIYVLLFVFVVFLSDIVETNQFTKETKS